MPQQKSATVSEYIVFIDNTNVRSALGFTEHVAKYKKIISGS